MRSGVAVSTHGLLRVIRHLGHRHVCLGLARLVGTGYLHETGWLRSMQAHASVDALGRPTPWMTYPCVEFLRGRLRRHHSVLEFGGGQSTLFFADHVGHVTVVESHPRWQRMLRGAGLLNVNVMDTYGPFRLEHDAFPHAAMGRFNLVVIDGPQRHACMIAAPAMLDTDGVIVLDDAARPEYTQGIEQLAHIGFKRIEFWGLQPLGFHKNCTMVFYRSNNCLGI